jgi:hypothetical protein
VSISSFDFDIFVAKFVPFADVETLFITVLNFGLYFVYSGLFWGNFWVVRGSYIMCLYICIYIIGFMFKKWRYQVYMSDKNILRPILKGLPK